MVSLNVLVAERDADAGPGPGVSDTIKRNMPLVYHVSGEISRRLPFHVSIDDLRSAGMLGLVQAANRFDAARGVPFAPFAILRIRGAIMDDLRHMDWLSRKARREEADAPTMVDFTSVWDGEDPPIPARQRDVLDRVECRDLRHWVLGLLDGRERQIMELYYGEGMTGRAIGERLSLSEGRIVRIRKQVLARLRRRLKAELTAA